MKFPPYFAGAAIQAVYLAEALTAMGFHIQFITDNDARETVDDVHRGLKVHRFRTFTTRASLLKECVYLFRIYWYVLTHPQFTIVHFHSIKGYEAFLFPFIKLLGRKIILKLTLVGSDDPMTFKQRKVGRFILIGLRFVDRFVAISTKLKELAVQAGIPEEKVRIIYNGTNTGKFHPLPRVEKETLKKRLRFSDREWIFCSIGKVEYRKGYDFLLQAWIAISRELPAAALLIGGPGNDSGNPYYVSLMKFCASHNLNNVYFLGHVDNVDEYMKISDCFLFCSRAEGFGTVLIEAMITGIPVVATNLPGVTEDIIKDSRIGRICYSQDAKDFARTTVDFMKFIDPLDVEAAAQGVRSHFSIGNIADTYRDLYEGTHRVV